jgi:hypothetical protein
MKGRLILLYRIRLVGRIDTDQGSLSKKRQPTLFPGYEPKLTLRSF